MSIAHGVTARQPRALGEAERAGAKEPRTVPRVTDDALFRRVAEAVEGVPWMSREQGRRVYDHLRATNAREVLDIGTCYGVSAAYMAAAVKANGGGRVVTVDSAQFDHESPALEMIAQNLARAEVDDVVETVRIEHSSYAWWLKEEVERRSDDDGNCEPAFDFVYLDGAKSLTIDGVSVIFVERLLRPGGWLLLDDLDWAFESNAKVVQSEGVHYAMSEAERREPHVRAIFELILKPSATMTQLRLEDERWGWAQKAPGQPRRYRVEYSRSLGDAALDRVRALRRAVRSRSA